MALTTEQGEEVMAFMKDLIDTNTHCITIDHKGQPILDEGTVETDDPIKIDHCVGCGYCCRVVQCFISIDLHSFKPNCPDLFWDGTKYRCKLFTQDKYKRLLMAEEGCCHPRGNKFREAMIAGNGKEITDEDIVDAIRVHRSNDYVKYRAEHFGMYDGGND